MKKPRVSTFESKTQLPSNHPLPLLDRAASGVLDSEARRLWKLNDTVPPEDLKKHLRAALLQSYYEIPEYDAFADHVRYNSLFRDFIGLDEPGEEWDSQRYQQLHHGWTVDQELRKILLDIIELVTQLPLLPDDITGFNNCNTIEQRLSNWIDQHCPKAVYFQQFTNPPVRRFFASVIFKELETKEPLSSLLTSDVTALIASTFPEQVKPEEGEFGAEELMFLTGTEEQSLLMNFNRASLSCNPTRFESWEDSVKPYIVPLMEICKTSRAYKSPLGATLQFGNLIILPSEVDLSDYFHMLPSRPPKVVPPLLMREENLSYEFPAKLMRSAQTSILMYEKSKQLLRCSYEINLTSAGYKVELDLESQWTEPFQIEDIYQVFGDLKNNLYAAFHSLITDRTRDLFE